MEEDCLVKEKSPEAHMALAGEPISANLEVMHAEMGKNTPERLENEQGTTNLHLEMKQQHSKKSN